MMINIFLAGSGYKVGLLGDEQGYWINLFNQPDLIINNEQLDAQDYSLNILLNTPGIDINPLSYREEYSLSYLSFQDIQFHCLNCFSGYNFTCVDCIAPTPPLYLQIEPKETSLSLYWKDNSSNELGFIIEVQNSTGDWEEIGRRNANGGEILPWPKFKMFWNHEGLIPNKNYCYRIVAWNDFGRSESLVVYKKTLPIENPCCLRITNVEETSITIQWRDNSLIEDGYKIIRNDNVVAYVNANNETGIISWKDEGLNPDTEYYYKAEAYNQYGSARTNSVCVKTKALKLPPNPPTDLTITSATETSISLKWKDNSNNETQWTLYSRTPPNTGEIKTIYSRGPHNEIAEGPWMTYTHTGLNPGTEYHYIVWANNEAGGSHSNDIIGKTKGHAELIITACYIPQPAIPWSPFCLYYEVKNVGTSPNESGLKDYIFWTDNLTNQVIWSGSLSTPVLQPGESYLAWGCVTSGFPEGCYTVHIFVGAKDENNWYYYYTSQCCWW